MSEQIDISGCPVCDQCGKYRVNMWAGEGLCSPCTRDKLGHTEYQRRYYATHDQFDQWMGPDATIAALSQP